MTRKARKPTFTAQQKRALAWLPSNGAWRSGQNAELNCLLLFPIELIQAERVDGTIRWRLTPAGVQAKGA